MGGLPVGGGGRAGAGRPGSNRDYVASFGQAKPPVRGRAAAAENRIYTGQRSRSSPPGPPSISRTFFGGRGGEIRRRNDADASRGDGENDAEGEPGRDETRSAEAHEGKGEPGHRRETDRHPHVLPGLRGECDRDSACDEAAEGFTRREGDSEAERDENNEDADDHGAAGEAPLLADDAEDEIRLALGGSPSEFWIPWPRPCPVMPPELNATREW